jgi:hypothetical protein
MAILCTLYFYKPDWGFYVGDSVGNQHRKSIQEPTSPPNPLSLHATCLPGEGEIHFLLWTELPSPGKEFGAEGEGSGVRYVLMC